MAFHPNVIDVHESSFEQDVIQKSHEKTVVVDFWAAWCGPCRMLGPTLERLASEPDSNFILAKVDVDANPGLAMRFGVQGIPAVKAFRDGRVAGEFVGAQPEPRVRQFLKEVAPGQSDQGEAMAVQLMAERRWEEASGAFQKLLVDDPGNAQLKFGLGRAMIASGRACDSIKLLEELLHEPSLMAQAERLLETASFVCEFGANGSGNDEMTVVEAQFRQAGRLLDSGKVAPALDGLLDVLRINKNYRNGRARNVTLGIFELLGDEDPLTNVYRREMASILF